MGRITVALILMLLMSGCAAVTSTVSGVAGAAFDGLLYMFQGAEESFPMSMRSSLVAVQRGLKKSGFHANVLEPVDDGYLIAFGNDDLSGKISLEKETESLTTVSVKVKDGAMRQESIERSLVTTIREQSKGVKQSDHFDFSHHKLIRKNPKATAKQVGWYLPGTLLQVHRMGKSEWLTIKMPSGKTAYLKGDLAATASK